MRPWALRKHASHRQRFLTPSTYYGTLQFGPPIRSLHPHRYTLPRTPVFPQAPSQLSTMDLQSDRHRSTCRCERNRHAPDRNRSRRTACLRRNISRARVSYTTPAVSVKFYVLLCVTQAVPGTYLQPQPLPTRVSSSVTFTVHVSLSRRLSYGITPSRRHLVDTSSNTGTRRAPPDSSGTATFHHQHSGCWKPSDITASFAGSATPIGRCLSNGDPGGSSMRTA